MGSASRAVAYWHNCLDLDHTVCGFCHADGKQVPMITDAAVIALRPHQRLAYQNKLKAAFRAHLRAEHPDRLAQVAWSRTIRANSAARSARGRPDEKGKTAAKATLAQAKPVGTRRSSHPVREPTRAVVPDPAVDISKAESVERWDIPARGRPKNVTPALHSEPADTAAHREKAMRAQSQRDEWLRRINSTPRLKS